MEEGIIPPTQEEIEEMKEMQEEQAEDAAEDNFEMNEEMKEAYGAPEPEEVRNPSTFLHSAAFGNQDTLRTTFLAREELGMPDFTVRFLQSLKTIAHELLDSIADEINKDKDPKRDTLVQNGIAIYFGDKIENVTRSGMSNEGFAMNLNVTKKIESHRRRGRDPIENLQGGKRR